MAFVALVLALLAGANDCHLAAYPTIDAEHAVDGGRAQLRCHF